MTGSATQDAKWWNFASIWSDFAYAELITLIAESKLTHGVA